MYHHTQYMCQNRYTATFSIVTSTVCLKKSRPSVNDITSISHKVLGLTSACLYLYLIGLI